MIEIDLDSTIRTPRLNLRPIRSSDRVEFVRMHNISREFFAPWSVIVSQHATAEELFDRQLQRTIDGLESSNDVRLCGFLDDGRLVGEFNLNEIVRGWFQNAYAGWKVSADVARTGIGTEGVLALIDFAFAPQPKGLGLHRLQANIIPTNTPSIKLAEKCGFRREGLALRYLQIAGAWRDHLMFARTVEETLEEHIP